MEPNQSLLAAIRARSEKQTEFNGGIITADRYAVTLQQCVGSDLCYRYGAKGNVSFDDAVKRASNTLTYNNPDMVAKDIYSTKTHIAELDGIEIPKNTLMVFRHVLTTPRKDRDGDILRTAGAQPDPKMLLLWQHVHTLPIGKMLAVTEHNSKTLEVVSAVVDINELAQDAAVMIDNGMGRFSHGFRALAFSDLKAEDGKPTGKGGFDVKSFEIMEESLVSVPSNVDAEVAEIMLDMIEGDKLTSSMMKAYGKKLRSVKTTTTVAGGLPDSLKEKGKDDDECPCGKKPADCDCEHNKPAPEKTDESADKYADDQDSDSDGSDLAELSKMRGSDGEKSSKSFYGTLPDSWEDIQDKLREQSRSVFIAKGLLPSDKEGEVRGYSSLIATMSSHAVWRVESYGPATPSVRYFKAAYLVQGGKVVISDEMEEVTIKVSAEVVAKAVDMQKAFDTKAGRVLSNSIASQLTEVHDDLEELKEHCSTRSGKALCNKCQGTVASVLKSAKPAETSDSGADSDMGVDVSKSTPATILSAFIQKAEESDVKHAISVLSAIDTTTSRHKLTRSFRKLVGLSVD